MGIFFVLPKKTRELAKPKHSPTCYLPGRQEGDLAFPWQQRRTSGSPDDARYQAGSAEQGVDSDGQPIISVTLPHEAANNPILTPLGWQAPYTNPLPLATANALAKVSVLSGDRFGSRGVCSHVQ